MGDLATTAAGSALMPLIAWLASALVLHAVAALALIGATLVTAVVLVRIASRWRADGAFMVALGLAGVLACLVPAVLAPDQLRMLPGLLVMTASAASTVLMLAGLVRLSRGLRQLPTLAEFHQANEALGDAMVGRQLAQSELARSERRFQHAFTCSAVATLITDARGRILRHNRAVNEWLGWGGQRPGNVSRIVHEDDRSRLPRMMGTAFRSGSMREELRLRGPGDRLIWVSASVAPMSTGAGQRPEFVWQLQDVTERKAYEHTLREARDEADRLVTERTAELARTNQRLAHANRRLSRMAAVDQLTGIGNRRYLDQQLDRLVAAAGRYGHELSVLMLDIDHFKAINDRHGHAAGDRALAQVAGAVRANCRQSDAIGRYGGDELCVVLAHTAHERMHSTAMKIRETVNAIAIDGYDGRPFNLTCSIGGASWRADMSTAGELLKLADQALYRAKREGRDRVVLADAPRRATIHNLVP